MPVQELGVSPIHGNQCIRAQGYLMLLQLNGGGFIWGEYETGIDFQSYIDFFVIYSYLYAIYIELRVWLKFTGGANMMPTLPCLVAVARAPLVGAAQYS